MVEEEGVGVNDRHPVQEDDAAPMLAMAAALGRSEVMAWLLGRGADPEVCSLGREARREGRHRCAGYTPLMFAARVGFLEGVRLLLGKGAAAAAVNDEGVSALAVAAAFDCPRVAKLLVDAGADPDAKIRSLWSLQEMLQLPRVGDLQPPPSSGRYPGSQSRWRPLADLPGGTTGARPLWIAAAVGSAGVVRVLLDAGADRGAKAPCAGLEGTAPDELECTPQRMATLNDMREAVALLSTGGGDEALAAEMRREPPAELKRKVRDVLARNDVAALRRYLDAGLGADGDLGERGDEVTPLWAACESGSPGAVRLLLERGADPNRAVRMAFAPDMGEEDARALANGAGRVSRGGPLFAAVAAECEECVALLLGAGAQADQEDWIGATPLAHAAAECRRTGVAARLIAAGASLEAALPRRGAVPRSLLQPGATPLWIAAAAGRAPLVRLLLDAGADAEVEAVCSFHPDVGTSGRKCSVRRIAELQGAAAVLAILDAPRPPAAAPPP
jgi:ankyrin repeat protein